MFILFFILVSFVHHSCLSFLFTFLFSAFNFFLVHSSRIWIFDLNTVHKWHCRIRKVIFHNDFLLIFVDLFTLLECCFDYLLLFLGIWFHQLLLLLLNLGDPQAKWALAAEWAKPSKPSRGRSALNWFHNVINQEIN